MSDIQVEIGKVIEAYAGRARVEVSQSGMCSHCEMSSNCVPGAGGIRIIEVADPIGVSANQQVRIELSGKELIGASFLAYLTPLIGLLIGAIVGFYSSGSARANLWGSIGAIVGLTSGLLISRLLGQHFTRSGKLTPTITDVIVEYGMEDQENAN